jgi:P27 family predicted phage terminase small subunit
MPAGRKPKPTHLKLIEGNPGKRPVPRSEPKPEPKAPKPPTDLHGDALREWRRVAPQLERLGLLTGLDRAALSAYCWAWARLLAAQRVLADSGVLVKQRGNRTVKNPAIQVARDAAAECRAWCAEFGMTPSARGRMALPDRPGDDDLDTLLDRD